MRRARGAVAALAGLAALCIPSLGSAACRTPWPSDTKAKEYFDLRTEACAKPFMQLKNAVGQTGGFENAGPIVVRDYAKEFNDYDRGCLELLSDLPCPVHDFLMPRFGALFASDEVNAAPVCSLARVGRRLALTARHCLVHPGDGRRRVDRLSLWVALLAGPDRRFKVLDEHSLTNNDRRLSDFGDVALLVVDFEDVPPPAPAVVGQLHAKAPIRVPFVFTPAAILDGNAHSAAWVRTVRVDYALQCRRYQVQGRLDTSFHETEPALFDAGSDEERRCVVHGCQTFGGASGAPIVTGTGARGAGDLVVAGIHLRQGVVDDGRVALCGRHKEHNVGTTIRDDVVKAISEEAP